MTKEQFKDSVIIAMKNVLNEQQMAMLDNVLVERLQNVEFQEAQLLATTENSNEYLIDMFQVFKGQRLSEKTMKAYLNTLRLFQSIISKPFTQVTTNDVE